MATYYANEMNCIDVERKESNKLLEIVSQSILYESVFDAGIL
jgi:hypothetical protein